MKATERDGVDGLDVADRDVPVGLGVRGRRLWASLLTQDASLGEVDAPSREVALSACRTADRLESLEALAEQVEPFLTTRSGAVIHPVLAEVRQQSALLARLVAALRLPDAATGRRPQRRQLRGVQQPSGVNVTALERARARKGG